MKLLRMPTAKDGEWWVVCHDYVVKDEWLRSFRPIHVFTHLSQAIVDNKTEMFNLSIALENKLFSSRNLSFEVRKAISEIGDPAYKNPFLKSYDPYQRIISFIESYLESIYSALEITAKINRAIDNNLPMGFREQSKKYEMFSFEKNKWLPMFYDIRSELTHYNTLMFDHKETSIIIGFSTARDLEHFDKGIKYKIDVSMLLSFHIQLFDLLDSWAKELLKKVDENYEIQVATLIDVKTPPKIEKIKAKVLLDMVLK